MSAASRLRLSKSHREKAAKASLSVRHGWDFSRCTVTVAPYRKPPRVNPLTDLGVMREWPDPEPERPVIDAASRWMAAVVRRLPFAKR